uniref:Uncharacterized protein n=1 Tax=Parascaris univalens TaxID=6257 RepID=A0A914ZF61_PARUN
MDDEKDTRKIFIFGLCVLFGWMIVVIICASPKLFRDLFFRHCCCCCQRRKEDDKIEQAKARVRSASKSFLVNSIAAQPSAIFLHQILGSAYYVRPEDTIPEESRSNSQQPVDGGTNTEESIQSAINEIP